MEEMNQCIVKNPLPIIDKSVYEKDAMLGTLNLVLGEAGTGKSSWAIQTAYEMTKDFKNANIIIYDNACAVSEMYIKKILDITPEEYAERFLLVQNITGLDDIYNVIERIIEDKKNNMDDYLYDTGRIDKYGDLVRAYVPTVIILDQMILSPSEDIFSMEAYTSRGINDIRGFLKDSVYRIKKYNITIFNNTKLKRYVSADVSPSQMLAPITVDIDHHKMTLATYLFDNIFKFEIPLTENVSHVNGFEARILAIKSKPLVHDDRIIMRYTRNKAFNREDISAFISRFRL